MFKAVKNKAYPIVVKYNFDCKGIIHILASNLEEAVNKAIEMGLTHDLFDVVEHSKYWNGRVFIGFYSFKIGNGNDQYSTITSETFTIDEIQLSVMSKFESEINQGEIYKIDDKYYKNRKHYLEDWEIWDLVPSEYVEMLRFLRVEWEFINAVRKNIEFFNDEGRYRKAMSRSYKNFADFMNCAFKWTVTPDDDPKKGFKWWYQKIFAKNFIHPTGASDDLFYGRSTNAILAKAIEDYDVVYIREFYEEKRSYYATDEFNSKESFYDAYGDGFSDFEDEHYWDE